MNPDPSFTSILRKRILVALRTETHCAYRIRVSTFRVEVSRVNSESLHKAVKLASSHTTLRTMSSLSCENVQLQQRYAAGKFDEFCDIKLVDCDNKTSYGIPSGLLVTYSTNLVEMAKAVKEQAVHTSLTPNALKVFVQAIFGKPLTETCPIDSEANIATLQSLYEFGHKLDVVGLQEALVVDIKSPSYSHPQPAAMGNFYASIHKEDLLLSNEVFEALLQHVQFAKRSIYPMPTVTGYIPDHALAPRHIERLVSVLNTWTHYDAEQKLQVLLLEMKTVMSAEVGLRRLALRPSCKRFIMYCNLTLCAGGDR